jgi:hypothetical protein
VRVIIVWKKNARDSGSRQGKQKKAEKRRLLNKSAAAVQGDKVKV